MEDLNFLLKSGIVLCRLIHKIFPQSQIDLEALQVRFSLKHSVRVFFSVWKSEHEEEEYLPVPDICPGLRAPGEISVQAGRRRCDGTLPQVCAVCWNISTYKSSLLRVTRALFALAERTKMDPDFTGEPLSYTDMTSQSLKRKVSGNPDTVQTGSLNAIFENLMQVRCQIVRSGWLSLFFFRMLNERLP